MSSKKKKNIMVSATFLSLIFVIILKLWKSYPLSNLVPLFSSDFASHIFKIQYLIEYGISGWNYFWYGGFPFLKFYPPLSYMIAASIGELTGAIFAYNLVFDIAWVLTPVAFYLFLREYGLNKKQIIFSLIFFSLLPSSSVFFKNGNMPLMLSFLLSVLFWRSVKRAFEKKENVGFSIIFLSFALLSHVLIGFLSVLLVTVWFLTSYFKKDNITKLFSIFLISGIIVSFWYLPFIGVMYLGRYGSVSVSQNPIQYTLQTVQQRLELTVGTPTPLFIIIAVLSSLAFLFSLKKWRDKHFREFFPVLVVSIFLFLLLDYKRIVLFITLFLPFILFLNLKKKWHIYFLHIPLLIFLLISFSFFNLEFRSLPEIPKTGNRVIYYGDICERCSYFSVFLPFLSGDEIIWGWEHTAESATALEGKKIFYLEKIGHPLNLDYDTYRTLANAGMVNYVVIDKNYSNFLNYFNSNPYFKESKIVGNLIVYEAEPKFSFLDINDKEIESNINKNIDEIDLEFNCKIGNLTIKETYDNGWEGYLDNKKINLKINDYGFIQTQIDKEGACKLKLKYGTYNPIFILSFLLGAIIIYVFINWFIYYRMKLH